MWSAVTMRKENVYIAFLFLCIAVIYFAPVVFSSQTFASRDLYNFFTPRRFFAAETIRNGSIPLWNPYLASGVPFLANHQSSLFYPLSMLYYVLPFHMGFKCFIIIHYYLAGLFMFFLMRHWRYDCPSSITAGIVFMFGGYMISILDNLAFLTSAVWLPLIVLFFDRSLRERRSRYSILTGIIIGFQILGGDASCYILSTFLFMFAYLLYYLITEEGFSIRGQGKVLFFFPLAWVIGIGVSAIQIVPFIEFLFHSTRMEGLTYEEITKWSYNPLELLQLLVPYLFGTTVPMSRWFGQLWLDTLYIGVFPLVLVLGALSCSRNRFTFFMLLIIFFSLFMAFGKYNLFGDWFASLPGINRIHYPVKYLFLTGFSLAVLSGRGFSVLFENMVEEQRIKPFILFLCAVNLLFIALLVAGFFMEETLFSFFAARYPQTLFHNIVGAGASFLAVFQGYSLFVMLLVSVSLFMVLTARGKIGIRSAKVLVIIIVLADLMFLGKPKDTLIASSLYTKPNEVITALKADPSHFRIFSLSYITFGGFMHIPGTPFSSVFTTLKSFMMPNLSLLFHINTVDEYAALLVKRYYTLFNPVKEFFRLEEKESGQVDYCKTLLNLLNVKYLISSFSLEDKDFKLVRAGKVKLYENRGVLPRAYAVPTVRVLKDDEEVLQVMEKMDFNPRESLLITRGEYEKVENDSPKENGVLPNNFKGNVKILKYSPNQVEIETNGNDSGFLVLADNFYPGWDVYVNGREETVLRVNYNLRGVAVPRGKNRVTFTFDPASFKIGFAITLFTLSGIIAFFVRVRRGKKV